MKPSKRYPRVGFQLVAEDDTEDWNAAQAFTLVNPMHAHDDWNGRSATETKPQLKRAVSSSTPIKSSLSYQLYSPSRRIGPSRVAGLVVENRGSSLEDPSFGRSSSAPSHQQARQSGSNYIRPKASLVKLKESPRYSCMTHSTHPMKSSFVSQTRRRSGIDDRALVIGRPSLDDPEACLGQSRGDQDPLLHQLDSSDQTHLLNQSTKDSDSEPPVPEFNSSPSPAAAARRNLPKFIILHYSPFKAVWDWVILLLVLYTAVFTPYTAAFLLNEEKVTMTLNQHAETRSTTTTEGSQADPLIIVDLIVDMMFIMDILISLRTTYVEDGDVISDPQKIAANYFKGWFSLDVVAAIPFDLLLFGSGGSSDTMTVTGVLKTVRLLRLLRVVRRIKQYAEYGSAVLLLLMCTFTLVAHWLACIWYALAYMERDKVGPKMGWLNILAEAYGTPYERNNSLKLTLKGPEMHSNYITALYFTLTALTSIGFGNVAPTTNSEKIFAIFAMLLGSLMSAAIFGNVSSMMLRLYQGSEEFHEKTVSIREFIQFHHIPKGMAHRLLESLQNNQQYTNGVDMNGVLKGFPECLQADICLHMNRNLLNNCPAFRGASPGCLRAFSMKFRSLHVPPGDTLIHPGDILDATYFIARGSIEILEEVTDITAGPGVEVLAVLGKNDIFGLNPKTSFPKQQQQQQQVSAVQQSHYFVRALSYTDMNKISHEDLFEILNMYSEWAHKFVEGFQITFDLNLGKFYYDPLHPNKVEETLKFIKLRKPKLQYVDRGSTGQSSQCSLSPIGGGARRRSSGTASANTSAPQKPPRISSPIERLCQGRITHLHARKLPHQTWMSIHNNSRNVNFGCHTLGQSTAIAAAPGTGFTQLDLLRIEAKITELCGRAALFEEKLSTTVDSILKILHVLPNFADVPKIQSENLSKDAAILPTLRTRPSYVASLMNPLPLDTSAQGQDNNLKPSDHL